MQILIVEDNAFNAYCLSRLFAFINKKLEIRIVNSSFAALSYLRENNPALVILDGDLGVSDGLHCNGPALANLIWLTNPLLPIVIWSDSEAMRTAFTDVFGQHEKLINEHNCWPKVVSAERISSSLPFLLNFRSPQRAASVRH
ncbi:Response regulator receiver domain protein [Legionella massiliensis]|uniref:Response regulator receiver domain protein n=1 Tax=Legionella massiliensis TaxID=1034943 RepID=A0A078KWG9_9GAMM|nr:response regulator [Legionella massiliensis]CDZ76033.1 Response regulator receiver domain protein [Legionella massiliensis]CEE11771.1 Response regulator receiver domain protein [Legionella massiliensis]